MAGKQKKHRQPELSTAGLGHARANMQTHRGNRLITQQPAARTAVCIGCGCDDLHACVRGIRSQLPMGATIPPAKSKTCHWLRLDRGAGFGVCSACPGSVERWDAGDRDGQ
jgi:hypothetical protein